MIRVKPYTEAFERNRAPIGEALAEALAGRRRVLEIGSGSGQHAVAYAADFPALHWQPTELPQNLSGIEAWRNEAGLPNLAPALALDVFRPWPVSDFDAVVTINTLHIVSADGVRAIIEGAGRALPAGGVLFVYGPFLFDDRPLEPSNARFDQWLRSRDPDSGLRRFSWVDALARDNDLVFERDRPMPANNHALWWRKAAVDA